MTQTILITGASGKVGQQALRAFKAAGWTTRTYQRGTDMTQAARGADVILNGMNPPNYHNWAKLIPQITAQHIAAAQASGATVILPGNVYTYGPTCHGTWTAETPHAPHTRKGRIRAEMEHAYRASGLQTIVLRAGNFIDPEQDDDVLSAMGLMALRRGIFTAGGPAEVRQAWAYTPDWAAAAVALAEQRATLARFEDVPFAGHTLTWAEMQSAVEAQVGYPLKTRAFPWWLMRLASPVWELAREMHEMRYLFALDHGLDGVRLSELCPDLPSTPLETILRRKLGTAVSAVPHSDAARPETA